MILGSFLNRTKSIIMVITELEAFRILVSILQNSRFGFPRKRCRQRQAVISPVKLQF